VTAFGHLDARAEDALVPFHHPDRMYCGFWDFGSRRNGYHGLRAAIQVTATTLLLGEP